MSATQEAPDVGFRQQRLVSIAITTSAIAAVAIGCFWFIARPGDVHSGGDEHAKVIKYSTVQAMAEHLGCISTLRAAQNPGTSSSAGDCTYDGALVEFRIYPTEPQALAWLEGNRSQSLGSTGIYNSFGLYGGTWVVVIHSTDRDLAHRAGSALQRQ